MEHLIEMKISADKDDIDGIMWKAIERIKDEVIEILWDTGTYGGFYDTLTDEIKKLVKQNEKKIIEDATSQIVERVAKKKEIVELTPRARDIAAISRDNTEFFVELIDKAISKRFGGK